ncbi:MAG: hypothetical protein AB7F75_03970 [Planctomycetota bacterium]
MKEPHGDSLTHEEMAIIMMMRRNPKFCEFFSKLMQEYQTASGPSS